MDKKDIKTPRFSTFLLRRITPRKDTDVLNNLFEENFNEILEKEGIKSARRWYRIQVIKNGPEFISHSIQRRVSMFRNYFRISIRNMMRNKGFALMNVAGLSVGIACVILILMYIINEISYDRFHSNLDRIYRISTVMRPPGDMTYRKIATTDWPVGIILRDEYPEVEDLTMISTWANFSIKHSSRYFYEKMFYADENFFKVFTFPLIQGDPETALLEPNTLVITEEIEQKYFGDESGLGKTLLLNDSLLFTVTGITENVPFNSHIQFDVVISFATFRNFVPKFGGRDIWGNLNIYNYVLLRNGADREDFRSKINGFVDHWGGDIYNRWGYDIKLVPDELRDIYLYDKKGSSLGPGGNIDYIWFLSAVALFILIIACINFINLTTARSSERAREVGIRKVVGSERRSIIRQFLFESVLMGLIAMLAAFLFSMLSIDHFENLTNREYVFSDLISVKIIIIVLPSVILTGLAAGIYPALVMSGFTPLQVLKGAYRSFGRGTKLREVLVVFQFVVSISLILSTFIVYDQFRFMLTQDKGFDDEQIAVIGVYETPYASRTKYYQTFKQRLLSHHGISKVTAAGAVPGKGGWNGQFARAEGQPDNAGLSVEYIAVDHDYSETFGLEIVAGRDFSELHGSDRDEALLINETAAEALGWGTSQNAIGKRIESPSGYPRGVVVGVIKDYNHHDLKHQIKTIVFDINPAAMRYYAVRIGNEDVSNAMDHVRKTWSEIYPGYELKYFFLDEEYTTQYKDEEKLLNIFGTFASLAVAISCLGLLGLISYLARQKTKEIGIRKVLGGTAAGITKLLTGEFFRLIIIANCIALPLTYISMEQWLDNFAYRMNMDISLFLLTVLISLVIALATISFQTVKAATANPVNSLRYE